MGGLKLLCLAIGLPIALLAVACGENVTPAPPEDVASLQQVPTSATALPPVVALSPNLTPREFFARVELAMIRQGFVFHTFSQTVATTSEDGDSVRPLWTIEAWLDVAQQRGRSHFQKDPSLEGDLADSGATIVSDETAVFFNPLTEENRPTEGKASTCPFMDSPVLSMLIFACENLSAPPGGKVELDLEYNGQPAAAVTYLEEGENPVAFYVHRESLLPLAWDIGYGEPGRRSAQVTTYKNDFVPLDSLPPDFLDPASIGYVKLDPLASLDDPGLAVAVYWLGQDFDPPGGLPSLLLDERSVRVLPPGEGQGPGNRVDIPYRLDEGQPGTGVNLSLWQLEIWDEFLETPLGQLWWDSPCVETKEVSLEGGKAIIFMGHEPVFPDYVPPPEPVTVPPGDTTPLATVQPLPPPVLVPVPPGDTPLLATARPPPMPLPAPAGACPTGPFDYFLARAYLDETVVAVNLPFCSACVGRRYVPDPYDSLEGMEAVVNGLHLRMPKE